jgi:cysteine protease ATG4
MKMKDDVESSLQHVLHPSSSSSSSFSPRPSSTSSFSNDSATACALLRHDTNSAGERIFKMTESKFGAFGKDLHTLDSHDDSFTMGGEELQIISSHRSSISHDSWMTNSDAMADYENITNSERNVEQEDGNDDGDGDRRDSFSCVSILNPLACSSPSRVHQKQDSFTSEGFDICKEYGYKYEYTQDDDSISSSSSSSDSGGVGSQLNPLQSQSKRKQNENVNSSFVSRLRFTPRGALAWSNNEDDAVDQSNGFEKHNVSYRTFLLGKTYHPINDYHAKRDDESNLFWFTYRCDFVEIRPYSITSDAGWGCMLRSAQMLLAQVLRMHFKGREWRAERNLRLRREDPFVRSLLTWFADYPFSGSGVGGLGVDSWYSLHNMVAAGCAKYDVLPGEWFGPTTVCYVMRDLVELQQAFLKQGFDEENDGDENDIERFNSTSMGQKGNDVYRPLKVYIAPEGTIYNSDICKLVTTSESTNGNSSKNTCMDENPSLSLRSQKRQDEQDSDDDPKCNHPLSEIPSITNHHHRSKISTIEWNSSLLILIPLRLGLEKFNASSYSVPLAHMLSLPQSVGFLGGSPRHALWFYGADSDGRKVYGLDPHVVQRAPRRCRKCHNGDHGNGSSYLHEIVFTDEYLRSINCPNISVMATKKIDPSLALGFYCRDCKDYESFCSLVQAMKVDGKFTGYPELFTFADAKPNYEADVSSAMVEMMATCQTLDGEESDRLLSGHHVDEDDEYVML